MRSFYDLKGEMLTSTMTAYRVMLFATFFSGVRCLYQGIIIANHRTKWLTIGHVHPAYRDGNGSPFGRPLRR